MNLAKTEKDLLESVRAERIATLLRRFAAYSDILLGEYQKCTTEQLACGTDFIAIPSRKLFDYRQAVERWLVQ